MTAHRLRREGAEMPIDFDEEPAAGNLERISGDIEIEVTFPAGNKATVTFDEPVIHVAWEDALKSDDILFDLFRIGSNAINADHHRMSLKDVLLETVDRIDEGIRDPEQITAEAIATSLETLAKTIRSRSSKA